jgi:hypothetical protein
MNGKWRVGLEVGSKIAVGLGLSLLTSCFVILAIVPTTCDYEVLFLFYSKLSQYLFASAWAFFFLACLWFMYSKLIMTRGDVERVVDDGARTYSVADWSLLTILTIVFLAAGSVFLFQATEQVFTYGLSSPDRFTYEEVCKKRPTEDGAKKDVGEEKASGEGEVTVRKAAP